VIRAMSAAIIRPQRRSEQDDPDCACAATLSPLRSRLGPMSSSRKTSATSHRGPCWAARQVGRRVPRPPMGGSIRRRWIGYSSVINYSGAVPFESGSWPVLRRAWQQLLPGVIAYTPRPGRHSSAVGQLFRKSPALCAVLPRVEARYKRAHLSAIRFEGLPVPDRRYGSLASNPPWNTLLGRQAVPDSELVAVPARERVRLHRSGS
jgi:hypothetical protein